MDMLYFVTNWTDFKENVRVYIIAEISYPSISIRNHLPMQNNPNINWRTQNGDFIYDYLITAVISLITIDFCWAKTEFQSNIYFLKDL